MPKKAYSGWAHGTPAPIEPHSLAKHRILREYVETYVRVLTRDPRRAELRLALVDGFAGGGDYVATDGTISPGSPLILLDAIPRIVTEVNANRRKPLAMHAHYYFVEKDLKVAAYLADVLRRHGHGGRPDVTIRVGEFEQQLEGILDAIRGTGRANPRALFVLDQYGYSDVPISALTRIFARLANAEVFLTLSVGWMTAYLANAKDAAAKLGIGAVEFQELCKKVGPGLDLSDDSIRPSLRQLQRLLDAAFESAVGARYRTPFFIVSRKSNRAYWFLHIANNLRASDVVKELHWSVQNHFEHYGGPGLGMLGYDPDRDSSLLRQQPLFSFDAEARAASNEALLRDLPRRIRGQFVDGVSFGNLVGTVSNETPATEQQLSDAVVQLVADGELTNQGSPGARRDRVGAPDPEDRITLARQPRLFSHDAVARRSRNTRRR